MTGLQEGTLQEDTLQESTLLEGTLRGVPSRRLPSKKVPCKRVPSWRVPSRGVPSKRVPYFRRKQVYFPCEKRHISWSESRSALPRGPNALSARILNGFLLVSKQILSTSYPNPNKISKRSKDHYKFEHTLNNARFAPKTHLAASCSPNGPSSTIIWQKASPQ